MNLLTIEHIHKVYGEKTVFEDASCGIQEGDKIGIIGINGTGKTTLAKVIANTTSAEQSAYYLASPESRVSKGGDHTVLCDGTGRR